MHPASKRPVRGFQETWRGRSAAPLALPAAEFLQPLAQAPGRPHHRSCTLHQLRPWRESPPPGLTHQHPVHRNVGATGHQNACPLQGAPGHGSGAQKKAQQGDQQGGLARPKGSMHQTDGGRRLGAGGSGVGEVLGTTSVAVGMELGRREGTSGPATEAPAAPIPLLRTASHPCAPTDIVVELPGGYHTQHLELLGIQSGLALGPICVWIGGPHDAMGWAHERGEQGQGVGWGRAQHAQHAQLRAALGALQGCDGLLATQAGGRIRQELDRQPEW